ncbi:MAG: ribbon-helix-helix domain-containing protein [Lachnospiraceae bacterium]|nr:ribbon-helix-helix domain-containing protein [Lachnospiraceae bacterium]
MARAKKDGKFFNCYIKQDLWEKITEYSEVTRLPKTAIVEKALEDYFEVHKLETERPAANE